MFGTSKKMRGLSVPLITWRCGYRANTISSPNKTKPVYVVTGNFRDRSSTLLIDHHRMSMGDSSAKYIHMVQHLIEKCLTFHMSKEECMEALSKHAQIEPVITSTVWTELEKENKEFFEAYSKSKSEGDRMSEAETIELIQKIISDSSKDSGD